MTGPRMEIALLSGVAAAYFYRIRELCNAQNVMTSVHHSRKQFRQRFYQGSFLSTKIIKACFYQQKLSRPVFINQNYQGQNYQRFLPNRCFYQQNSVFIKVFIKANSFLPTFLSRQTHFYQGFYQGKLKIINSSLAKNFSFINVFTKLFLSRRKLSRPFLPNPCTLSTTPPPNSRSSENDYHQLLVFRDNRSICFSFIMKSAFLRSRVGI